VDISIPAAVTVFPGEIYRAPHSWCERAYHKLIYFNEVDKGGHFACAGYFPHPYSLANGYLK
jgi:hypothetical protein